MMDCLTELADLDWLDSQSGLVKWLNLLIGLAGLAGLVRLIGWTILLN